MPQCAVKTCRKQIPSDREAVWLMPSNIRHSPGYKGLPVCQLCYVHLLGGEGETPDLTGKLVGFPGEIDG